MAKDVWLKDICRSARYTSFVTAPEPITVMSQRSDFLAANSGLRVARAGFVLLVKPNGGPNGGRGKRYGITVTKRIGNAVVRNRMKRRFRALLRDYLPELGLPDHDHVLIGRDKGVERAFFSLESELTQALKRAAAGKGDPSRKGGSRRPARRSLSRSQSPSGPRK